MDLADELGCWHELRDMLRAEYIHCERTGRSFPSHRQRLMDHAESMIARLERLKRSAPRHPRSPRPQSTTPNPAVTPREENH
jgi:hypothetical protein